MKNIAVTKSLLVLVLCFVITLFCGVKLSDAASSQIILTYAGNLPIAHYVTEGMEFFAKKVEAKTNGKVKVQVYPAGQLISDKDMAKSIMSGAVDLVQVTCGGFSGLEPSWMFFDLPGVYKNPVTYHKMMDSEAGKILKEEFEKNTGVKHLFWMDDSPSPITLKMPMKAIGDFKGKRIRCPAPLVQKMVQALGAAPVFMGGGEQYLALQRGIIDGTVTNIASVYDRKLYEVATYIWNPGVIRAMYATIVNKKKWDSLPADVQKAILEAAEEAKQFVRAESQKELDLTEARLKEKGMTIYHLSDSEKRCSKRQCSQFMIISLRRAVIKRNFC